MHGTHAHAVENIYTYIVYTQYNNNITVKLAGKHNLWCSARAPLCMCSCCVVCDCACALSSRVCVCTAHMDVCMYIMHMRMYVRACVNASRLEKLYPYTAVRCHASFLYRTRASTVHTSSSITTAAAAAVVTTTTTTQRLHYARLHGSLRFMRVRVLPVCCTCRPN